jgi:hypothetical protein
MRTLPRHEAATLRKWCSRLQEEWISCLQPVPTDYASVHKGCFDWEGTNGCSFSWYGASLKKARATCLVRGNEQLGAAARPGHLGRRPPLLLDLDSTLGTAPKDLTHPHGGSREAWEPSYNSSRASG